MRPTKRARRRFRRPITRRISAEAKFIALAALVAVAILADVIPGPQNDDIGPARAASPSSRYDFACDVAYVNDGDTLRCRDGTRVRLHAIAAREADGSCAAGHPCPNASPEDSKATLQQLAGGRLNCIRTGASYGRVTAICDNDDGVEINCAMVERGLAARWERFDRQRAICRSSR